MTVQRPTLGLFDEQRTSLDEAIELTVASLRHYGSLYKHWAISFSGGKDSSAVVTLVIHLIETGQIPKPDGRLTKNQNRLGPLTLETRRWTLDREI